MTGVWVVGSINHDTCLGLRRHARPGETVTATSVEHRLGGKGLNQAVAARRAGVSTVMVGAVGNDPPGTAARALLADEDIDAELHSAAGPTGAAIVTVDQTGENAIVVVPEANGAIPESFAVDRIAGIGPQDVVVLQLELPLSVVAAVATTARRAGATVVLNAAPALPNLGDLVNEVDVLVVNASELDELVPDRIDRVSAANDLHDRHGCAVVVTLGSQGSLLVDRSGMTTVPARPARALDTTGAGDTYTGYLAATIADGRPLHEAMARASTAAAIAVSRPGGISAIPHDTEVPIPSSGGNS